MGALIKISHLKDANAAQAKWPKAVSGYERNMLISNRYVEDGSYLKLKSLNIGYVWKPNFKGISNVNVYASATNLFTITGYSWFDPEVNAFGVVLMCIPIPAAAHSHWA